MSLGGKGLVAPSASQHSPVCATNPNEAALCGGSQAPVGGDLSAELNNRGKMQRSDPLARSLTPDSHSHTHKPRLMR